jgi:hypothetical protein
VNKGEREERSRRDRSLSEDPVFDELLEILRRVATGGDHLLPTIPRWPEDDRPPIEQLPASDAPQAAALDPEDLEALWRAKSWLQNGGYLP